MAMNLSLLFLACGLLLATCKIFEPCELAKQLLGEHDVPQDQLDDWICIAKGESDFNSNAINTNNVDGTWDYGIFQLNSGYWCQGQKTKSNGCDINCKDFLSDNITESVNCAKIVIHEQGFKAWVAWNQKCQGNLSSYTDDCDVV